MKGLPILLASTACLVGGMAPAQTPSHVCSAFGQKLKQRPAALEGRALDQALFEAASLDCAGIAADLLARGASVKARNGRGASALSIAASQDASDVAGLLLRAGADVHHRDLAGALH